MQADRQTSQGVKIQFLADDMRDKSGKYLDWNLDTDKIIQSSTLLAGLQSEHGLGSG